MVKKCCYGLCNTDSRYEDRLKDGVFFIPFPKKSNLEKCLKWIKSCGRPHSQLNVDNITRATYICSKHFVENGPTDKYPDPIPYDGQTPKPARKLPTRTPQPETPKLTPRPSKRVKLQFETPGDDHEVPREVLGELQNLPNTPLQDTEFSFDDKSLHVAASQTDGQWVDPIDVLQLTVEKRILEQELSSQILQNDELRTKLTTTSSKKTTQNPLPQFSATAFKDDDKLMKYYTGFSYIEFSAIFKFLVPDVTVEPFDSTRPMNHKLNLENQLFLTLCKLRNNFDFLDLGHRFSLSSQDCSFIFSDWINYMFLRFGEISIWPPRDIIFKQMPQNYKKDFPNTFAIVDCTEIKIQKPSSLKAQSQTYSDYKSTNTLKALVAVDPRGSLLFASCLFSGSISDQEIFKQSGFKISLKNLASNGYLHEGDGIMADKGFNIQKDVEDCGLKLNIPPFASAGTQMSHSDVLLTKKIAAHRVHVERTIGAIKKFKILSNRIPLGLFGKVNQIWYVCAFLTTFQKPIITAQ